MTARQGCGPAAPLNGIALMKLALIMALAACSAPSAARAQPFQTKDAQAELLASQNPGLARNKQLVYDMYREVLLGGRADLVERYFTVEYLQHNPNVASGRDALAQFIRGSRPERPVNPTITLPLINIIAERDLVLVVTQRPMRDDQGEGYITSWFDLFRIADGKIAEHWDPALKSPAMLSFDPNSVPDVLSRIEAEKARGKGRPGP